jgi:hypothetical protein
MMGDEFIVLLSIDMNYTEIMRLYSTYLLIIDSGLNFTTGDSPIPSIDDLELCSHTVGVTKLQDIRHVSVA